MSIDLTPLDFPLRGSRLIEASAGTGKTWTIAALYVRLVLGHGGDDCRFGRPLQPAEILVMTFTRAATRELSDRIRQRLVEAARCFRGQAQPDDHDVFLQQLIAHYHDDAAAMEQAAHRLMLAAEAMDDSAVFTIDAWCQRMLREHAFDSGSLFDEELIESERNLYRNAVKDYWRKQVYALCDVDFADIYAQWQSQQELEKAMRGLVERARLLPDVAPEETLAATLTRGRADILRRADLLKPAWQTRGPALAAWFAAHQSMIKGNIYQAATVENFFRALNDWAHSATDALPAAGFDKAWDKWEAAKLVDSAKKGCTYTPHPDFVHVATLKRELDALPKLAHCVLPHAAVMIAQRMAELKAAARKFGFADMLSRLKSALEGKNGGALRARIVTQYPVALIDEFQDTSPDQYRIFDRLYRVGDDCADNGLFLIGDPKQAIYGFRGADIHSYLAARRATAGRHYRLGTNFRSTGPVVETVNHLFGHAEGHHGGAGHPRGAFGFRRSQANPLPFDPVSANGRDERLMCGNEELRAMTVWVGAAADYADQASFQQDFAALCAERIVTLLNDASVRFEAPGKAHRLQPADIAVLVRDRFEAAAIQRALRKRSVASVYLSDKDSVFKGDEAADVLRWLYAVANPLDGDLARAAFATRTAQLPLEALAVFTTDDLAWEARVEQLKRLKQVWQRRGVLAMLRQFIHELDLPSTMLAQSGGERGLTNLLHLAELLQNESQKLDGEQALIRWLAEQIESDTDGDDERTLRLESDAQLVKVITVHKSKGLEYPLVFLPFAVAARPFTGKNKTYVEYTDANDGERRIDFTLSADALAAMEAARLEEDLRLLYVALTRARHGLWLGVASVKGEVHLSALGYLINGGTAIPVTELKEKLGAMCAGCGHIDVLDAAGQTAAGQTAVTALSRADERPPLVPAPVYDAEFERDWGISSYTSITRDLHAVRAPSTPMEEKLLEEGADAPLSGPLQDQPWHRFPRGAIPGQFLHEQLEWIANEGFAQVLEPSFEERLAARCERAGWGHRQEDTVAWLRAAVTTMLPALNARLCDLGAIQAETEFWVPANRMQTRRLDQLCQQRLLPGLARPAMSDREVTGMLRGFKDLVFLHDGRYWVLDYKSNALGNSDSAYHGPALQRAIVQHRYEVQGTIYLLALHRLLKSRLGEHYAPDRQLGGTLFFFLRGIGDEGTRGCYHLAPDITVLEEMDRLLSAPDSEEEVA